MLTAMSKMIVTDGTYPRNGRDKKWKRPLKCRESVTDGLCSWMFCENMFVDIIFSKKQIVCEKFLGSAKSEGWGKIFC